MNARRGRQEFLPNRALPAEASSYCLGIKSNSAATESNEQGHQLITEVKGREFSISSSTEEVYFSGGLRGAPTNLGWALYPISGDPNSDTLVFRSPQAHLYFATQECGLRLIGTCMRYEMDPDAPTMDVWESGKRDPSNNLNAADSWSAVGHQAEVAGDREYATCAKSLSVSLKLAGLRLRDISRKYHDQLRWALRDGKKPGVWFSNAALLELYADCHSLASELSSARDQLARLAGIHAGAPDRIDSLARLEDWVRRDINRCHTNQPIVALMLTASGTNENPGWLRRLGVMRNKMLHVLPMGADARVSGLTLQQVTTSMGTITMIRLAEPMSRTPLASQGHDPLIELSQLCISMEQLCRRGWKYAKYPASLPHFVARTDA